MSYNILYMYEIFMMKLTLIHIFIFVVCIILCTGFVTEVHHMNGKGENKGVVYCEMQVRENLFFKQTNIA